MTDRANRPSWTDDDIGQLMAHPKMSAPQLAVILGRSANAIRIMRKKLDAGWSPELSPWSQEDDGFLLQTTNLTAQEVATHLGRSRQSVAGRRQYLREATGVTFGSKHDKNPHVVGARPLLAKTCLGCGLLLSGKWFGIHRTKGAVYYRQNCNKCRAKEYAAHGQAPAKPDRHGKRGEALQVATLATAERSGQPWLDLDHLVLRDPTLTIFEKAIKLSRTYYATSAQCSANGYSSKVGLGLGDPERDQWFIDNPNSPEAVAS